MKLHFCVVLLFLDGYRERPNRPTIAHVHGKQIKAQLCFFTVDIFAHEFFFTLGKTPSTLRGRSSLTLGEQQFGVRGPAVVLGERLGLVT